MSTPIVVNTPKMSVLGMLIRSLTTDRSRRQLYITSLYSQVTHMDRMEMEIIQKLNSLMDLAQDNDVLQLPFYLRNVVWGRSPLKRVIEEFSTPSASSDHHRLQVTDENLSALSETIARIAPPWVRYSDLETMCQDTQKVMLFAAPQL